MFEMLVRNWWAIALRGLFAIIFGIMAFAWPQITLTSLIFVYGAYAFVDGAFTLAWSLMGRKEPFPWGAFLGGLAGVALGILTFIWPGMTTLVLLLIIAWWSIILGVFEIVAAIHLRKLINNEWFLGLAGVISVLFGILLIARPGEGALALLWLIGSFALVLGVIWVMLAFKLRGIKGKLSPA